MSANENVQPTPEKAAEQQNDRDWPRPGEEGYVTPDGTPQSVQQLEDNRRAAAQALIETGPDLLDYFDGDSPGGSWDGPPGNSSSTLEDTITGTLSGTLPPLIGSFTGEVTVEGVLAGTLPALTGSFIGHSDAVSGPAHITASSRPAARLAPSTSQAADLTPGAAPLATIRSTTGGA
jgi:hypothetical protein